MRVAVIFGGNSNEKEVSIHTGLSVVEAIKEDYDVIPINIKDEYVDLNKKLVDIDVVFIALHGGYGEDGRLQKYFEKHKINYTGSNSKASSIAMDKNKTKLIAQKHNIPILEWKMLSKNSSQKSSINSIRKLGFPLIIKPNDGGSTIGIQYVETSQEFNELLTKAFSHSKNLMIGLICGSTRELI